MDKFEVPSREETMGRLMRGYERVMSYSRDGKYTVADRLEERAEDSAEVDFILFENQAITFAHADRHANRTANAAVEAGLKPGDVVALLMLNRPEFVLTWLGLSKAGIITALINTSATDEILAHALDQVNAKAIIVGSELASSVADLPAADLPEMIFEQSEDGLDRSTNEWHDWNAMTSAASEARPDRSLREEIETGDPLYYIFTSGTTGLPKAARMSNLRFINAGEMMIGLMDFGADDTFYCFLPLYHGAGGMVVPSVALGAGRPFVLRRKFSTSGFWEDVRHHGITATYYIGEVVRYLLAPEPSPEDRNHSLRVMCGAGLRPDVWEAFRDRFGVEDVIEGLGSTEANYGITNVDNKIGSVGRLPYPDKTNIRILKWDLEKESHVRNDDGSPVEAGPGEVGELVAEVLGGTGVSGYFEGYTSTEATENKLLRDLFEPGDVWFRSGDLVTFDEDDYFYFVDRVGDTFRWKSENVATAEVEIALSAFSGPTTVNVYGVEIPDTEGRAGMVSLTYDDPDDFDPASFYRFACDRLADYAVPVFVRISTSADITTTFKLRKVELQREGYDPDRVGDDRLFVADADAGAYVPLSKEALDRLGFAQFQGAD